MVLPTVTVVGALIEDGQGRFLLAQRPADKSMPYLWEFPGGKLEVGETPEEALVREIYEEIGLTVSPASLRPITFVSLPYSDFHIILLCYVCLEWSGTPEARERQGGLEWVHPDDLNAYPMPEANRALVSLLQAQSDNKDTGNIKAIQDDQCKLVNRK